MPTRKQRERTAARDQAQDRSPKTIGDPPQQQPSIEAPPQPEPAASAQGAAAPEQPGALPRDEVARRAYDLYQQRGGGDGGDLDDWLQAERDLQQT